MMHPEFIKEQSNRNILKTQQTKNKYYRFVRLAFNKLEFKKDGGNSSMAVG